MSRAAWVAGIVLLLAGPSSHAQELMVDGRPDIHRTIEVRDEAALFELLVPFELNGTAEAYVKVLGVQGNPVYRNGTVGGAGWWTEVALEGPDGVREAGSTNGTDLVELGSLQDAVSYILVLRVHAPEGSLATPMGYQLTYVLAIRSNNLDSGSGGSLDPSRSVQPTIQSVASSPAPQDASAGLAIDAAYLPVALLVAAVAVLGVVRWRQSKRHDEGGD